MTRLSYLLPFLWALGFGADVPTTGIPTIPTATVTTAKPTDKLSTPAVTPANTAATHTTAKAATPQITTASATTSKPSTTVRSSPRSNTRKTTVKLTTEQGGTTSSGAHHGTTNVNNPTTTSPADNAPQPSGLPKSSTAALGSSTVATSSQPPTTAENKKNPTTQLATTSPTFSRTSEPSKESGVTNSSTTKTSSSTVSQSPSVTIPKTTAEYSTTSLAKETIPVTTQHVIPKQMNLENIEVNCTEVRGESLVKINIKPSSICGESTSKSENDTKEILKHICTALKPGYQPNKEKCHIDLGSGLANELVIINAYVQSSLSPDELYASLKHIKKDGNDLFKYDAAKYEEEDLVSIPLISAIVSLAVVLLIIAAIYGCWHQRQTRKREQRLTEEQTMENGYHDNPTLEVMETSPEMQEKKGGPNGELGDSWIVPLDNLTREDFDEEEDTHL
ncbi:podocalyxin [Dendropsophus ebraccatus]|uniref:podocalyxin n=1 Tax=Dendropsophus ebraccatus TaxID=150705 RepID=UPI0038318613